MRAEGTEDARAQTLFERGLELSTAERWADARAAFLESARLVPRASTYFNLAVSSLELGLGRAAIDALDRFDGLADPAKHADYSEAAARLRMEARERVGTLALSIAPADARVEIDGEIEPASGDTRVVLLDPGLHVVRVSADGREPRSIEVTITARETEHQRVELSPAAPTNSAKIDLTTRRVATMAAAQPMGPTAVDRAPASSSSLWSEPLTWIAVGVVVAAGATVAVLVATNSDDAQPYGGTRDYTFR